LGGQSIPTNSSNTSMTCGERSYIFEQVSLQSHFDAFGTLSIPFGIATCLASKGVCRCEARKLHLN
jgi:hypothetical protein